MPTYVFQHGASGDFVELEFRMQDRPSEVKIDGRMFRRIITLPQVAASRTVHNVASDALPRGWKYAKEFTSDNKPLFRCRKDIDEAVASANDHGEHVTYDN